MGLDRRVWSGSIQGSEVVFTYVSPDGEEGYPGTMALEVRYAVTEDGMVKITHQAVTDRDTILSLTNHTYFSLGGAGRKKVYDQRLWVDSAFYVESDEALLPTGQVLRVDGTPFDFQEPMAVGRNIQSDFPAVARNHGYDVTLIRRSRGFGRAAVLADAETGIELSVYTDYPAVHLYTGNFVEHAPGLDGAVYERHESVCLEAQSCPGANEFPQLGDICLRAGERYRHIIGYQFSLR